MMTAKEQNELDEQMAAAMIPESLLLTKYIQMPDMTLSACS